MAAVFVYPRHCGIVMAGDINTSLGHPPWNYGPFHQNQIGHRMRSMTKEPVILVRHVTLYEAFTQMDQWHLKDERKSSGKESSGAPHT